MSLWAGNKSRSNRGYRERFKQDLTQNPWEVTGACIGESLPGRGQGLRTASSEGLRCLQTKGTGPQDDDQESRPDCDGAPGLPTLQPTPVAAVPVSRACA